MKCAIASFSGRNIILKSCPRFIGGAIARARACCRDLLVRLFSVTRRGANGIGNPARKERHARTGECLPAYSQFESSCPSGQEVKTSLIDPSKPCARPARVHFPLTLIKTGPPLSPPAITPSKGTPSALSRRHIESRDRLPWRSDSGRGANRHDEGRYQVPL